MKGHNRIGNMIVPNDNYCRFEEWFPPLLDEMLAEQVDQVRANGAVPLPLCLRVAFVRRTM